MKKPELKLLLYFKPWNALSIIVNSLIIPYVFWIRTRVPYDMLHYRSLDGGVGWLI